MSSKPTSDRRVEPSASSGLGRRGRLHLTCAVAGLLGTAAWSAHSLGAGAPAPAAERWWSVASLVGFSAVAAASRVRWMKSRIAIDAVCTGFVVVGVVGWLRLAGPFQAWLAPIPPLLVLAHWVSGGRRMGLVALATAAAAELAALSSRDALAGVVASATAAWLGYELAQRPKRRDDASSTSRRRTHSGIGDVIDGKYRLIRRIGKGGMGRVYEARRISDEERVALKVLHPELAARGDALMRFRREVRATAELPPHRVARVFDVGSGGPGIEYVAMELLDGEDLGARLRRVRRVSCDDTVRIVEQVAEVLEAAASRGVVHRDVKPRNIFLMRESAGGMDVRLLDFGLCRLRDSGDEKLTRSGRILGTPGFLAPEQISSSFGELGPHTDVFALGCVAYQCLSGFRPFPARNPAAAVYEVLNHHPCPIRELDAEIPEAVEWALAIALAKRPEDRYTSASEFAKDLAAAARRDAPSGLAERGCALLHRQSAVTSTLTRS